VSSTVSSSALDAARAKASGRLTISPQASVHLDFCRGVAALAVMVSHLRSLFFVDHSVVQNGNPLVNLIYAATGFAHQSVIIFFVLSGLLISKSVLYPVRDGNWSWKTYLINRGVRLYVVLIPGMLLCAFWDHLGLGLTGAQAFYAHAVPDLGDWRAMEGMSFATFLGNLAFLQSIFFQSFGSNSPLWSLSYEFWYYMLFPLLILTLARTSGWRLRICYVAVATLIFMMVGSRIAVYFLMWLAGAFVALPRLAKWRESRRGFGLLGWVSVAAFGGALTISRFDALSRFGDLHLFVIAFLFVPVLDAIVRIKGQVRPSAYASLSRLLAGFSYTLYLTHMPLLFFIRAKLASQPRWQPDGLHLAFGAAIVLAVLTYAYGVFWLTESRTDWVRSYVRNLLKDHQKIDLVLKEKTA
jgi:peptidoglycan/LPS O-acetylase OafA/YrhL